jgi:23S rRNA pseudouridine1911/1915/1917 synthase
VRVTVPASLAGERVDRVVALVTGLARTRAAELVAGGGVSVDGRPVTSGHRRLSQGEELDLAVPTRRVDAGPLPDPAVDVPVVFADAHIIVVDKPAGLVVHPGGGTPSGTLLNGLLARFPDLAAQPWPDRRRTGIVHRLDKGTSGLLVVARTLGAHASLSAQLRSRSIERRYVALVWGAVDAPSGMIDAAIGRSVRDPLRMAVRSDGRRAVTRYQVEGRFSVPAPVTLLSCRLETGRTHQIRVHLAAIGHPIVGDARYAKGARPWPGIELARPFLHAASLGFSHPVSGEEVTFSSPLPPELEAVRGHLA